MNAVSKIIRIILFPVIFICIALPSMSQIDDMKPSIKKIVSQYNSIPAPVVINADEFAEKLKSIQNSLFFIDNNCIFNKVKVEFDSFLLPDTTYAKINFNWKSLISKEGKNILVKPAAKEIDEENPEEIDEDKPDDIYSIAVTDKKAIPVYAEGNVKISIPAKISHVTFKPGEVNKTLVDKPLKVTLVSCQNDVARLRIQGINSKKEIISIFQDDTGGRLENGDTEISSTPGDITITSRVIGKIAKIDIFFINEYSSFTFDISASAKPEVLKKELLDIKIPRYVNTGITPKSIEIDADSLKTQTQILSQRNDNVYDNYNVSKVNVKLPPVLNTVYATVDFDEPKLFNSKNENVKYYLERRCFNYKTSSKDLLLNSEDDEKPLIFSRMTGTVHIRYPATLRIVTLSSENPQNDEFTVTFNGSKVAITGNYSRLIVDFPPAYLEPIRAYDTTGRQLKKFFYSPYSGTNTTEFAFWGKPTLLQFVIVNKWITLDIPYNLPSSAKLPDLYD